MPEPQPHSPSARDLLPLLDELRPRQVLCSGTLCDGFAAELCYGGHLTTLDAPLETSRLEGLGRFDLVILSDTLEALSPQAGEHLLAALRDLHGGCFVVYLDPRGDETWSDHKLFALGLCCLRRYPGGGRLFGFDIATYKTTPDWLNPRFWANPEQWDRSWW